MNKNFRLPLAFASAALFFACGDTVENVTEINQTGMNVVDSVKELPKCTDDNEGERAVVKGETVIRVCVDGDWVAMTSDDSRNSDFSCTTEELKDKSGIKIVCNGDSVGVVLNGFDGKDGEKGKDGEDGKDAVLPSDSLENDSEKVAISLDSLVGYTQKGPFLKGSTVYLYELSDGRTLKQTNGNFTSKITRDDGRYKFTARDLVSQYAMLAVDGFYRNEVTGQRSDASLRLTALTDMRKRSSANVNLLTHLEFDRVYHLVTRGDSTDKKLTVKQAKRQAQKEILKQFHIELDSATDAEDMDVFGSSDADAALLAVSILLQGDSGTADLSVLLTEISNDIAEFGEWKNDSAKAAIADWVFFKDLFFFRKNVEGWGLNGGHEIGDFENVIEHFIMETYDVKNCGKEDNGKERTVKNKYSKIDGQTFVCLDGKMIVKRDHKYLNPEVEYGEMVDWRDREPYKTVTIDGQTWMAENLNFDYKVGGSIYGTYTDPGNSEAYGRHYTWAAAMDSAGIYSDNSKGCGDDVTRCSPTYPVQGICPVGWHMPSDDEWRKLYSAMGSSPYAMQAKGVANWRDATDAYGFSAIPADGYGYGNFYDVGFWSATESSYDDAYFWRLDGSTARLSGNRKYNGYSVRCVKD